MRSIAQKTTKFFLFASTRKGEQERNQGTSPLDELHKATRLSGTAQRPADWENQISGYKDLMGGAENFEYGKTMIVEDESKQRTCRTKRTEPSALAAR
jgi:hypothetical protein